MMSIKARRGLPLVALMVVAGALLLTGGASSPTEAQSLETQQSSASSAGAPGCPTDYTTATDLFFDDLENPASGNWTTSGTGWYYPPPVDKINATSGTTNFWGDDGRFESDHAISMVTGVTLPTGKLTYLSFNHDYGFESSTGPYRDGGVLEYSTNNGSTWIDAGPLITDNGYRGVISGFNSSNPLSGRQGFVGDSNGYISTRVNLSDLSALQEQSVRFRFRIGTDESVGNDGWFVDDLRVYTCEGDTTPPTVSSTSPANNATGIVLGKGLSATFSEEMDASDTDGDPSTLNASTFTLTKQGSSTPVEAQVSYDSATKKAILDPDSTLEANTTYTATIKGGSTGAEDLAGNALAEDYTWVFTTGAAPPTYIVKDLGHLGGFWASANGINDSGKVAGVSEPPSRVWHAFLYTDGQMQDLHTAAFSGSFSSALDINGSGHVVGWQDSLCGPAHAFLYDESATPKMQDLDELSGNSCSSSSRAYGINDSDHVVGQSGSTAFLYDESATPKMQNLGTLPGGTFRSEARDINDSGQIAGQARTSGGADHAFLYDESATPKMQDLGTLPDHANSIAMGINEAGLIVGSSGAPSVGNHAFLYDESATPKMQDLGTLGGTSSAASDINDSGLIVGSSTTLSGATHAFVYLGGDMQDLNDLIPAGSGVELRSATAINTSGQIVGEAVRKDNGQTIAFLATPDTDPPKVMGTSPANNATAVAHTTNAEATFSEEMDASDTDGDPSTLNASTFTLTKQGSSTPIAAQVSYDSATKKAILDPDSTLEANTTYTATIKGGSTGAEDLAGNALAEDYTWAFTTAAPPAPNCTKTGTANAETISGTSGADVICAGGGNDTVKGLGGNDILKGQGGNDKLLVHLQNRS